MTSERKTTPELEPRFQTVDDINFVEAGENQEPDLTVYLQEGEDLSPELAKLMSEKYWWMIEYWQKKGLPKEQLAIKTGDEEINLYNWGQQFSPRQMADCKDAISHLQNDTRFGVEGLQFILVTDERSPSLNGPEYAEELRGYANRDLNAITLTPAGVVETAYRNGELGDNFSELQGIIVHEMGHWFYEKMVRNKSIMEAWESQFGKFNSKNEDTVVPNYKD